MLQFVREKEDIWLSHNYDKIPYTDRKIQKATWQHKNVTKKLNYTKIADGHRTVRWGIDSHQTGVVKSVYAIQTFPLTVKAV